MFCIHRPRNVPTRVEMLNKQDSKLTTLKIESQMTIKFHDLFLNINSRISQIQSLSSELDLFCDSLQLRISLMSSKLSYLKTDKAVEQIVNNNLSYEYHHHKNSEDSDHENLANIKKMILASGQSMINVKQHVLLTQGSMTAESKNGVNVTVANNMFSDNEFEIRGVNPEKVPALPTFERIKKEKEVCSENKKTTLYTDLTIERSRESLENGINDSSNPKKSEKDVTLSSESGESVVPVNIKDIRNVHSEKQIDKAEHSTNDTKLEKSSPLPNPQSQSFTFNIENSDQFQTYQRVKKSIFSSESDSEEETSKFCMNKKELLTSDTSSLSVANRNSLEDYEWEHETNRCSKLAKYRNSLKADKKEYKKKSLFEDSESDCDLFSSKSKQDEITNAKLILTLDKEEITDHEDCANVDLNDNQGLFEQRENAFGFNNTETTDDIDIDKSISVLKNRVRGPPNRRPSSMRKNN